SPSREPINRCKTKALGLSIVPAESCKNTDLTGDLLFGIHSEAILQGPVLPRCCDIRYSPIRCRLAKRIGVSARVRAIFVVQQAHNSGMLPGLPASLDLKYV